MSMVDSLADWIGSFIPDDFGTGSALFKGVMREIIDSGLDMALQKVTDMIQSLPGKLSDTILSRSKLTEYLTDICEQVTEAMKNRNILLPSFIPFDMSVICKNIPDAVDMYAQFMKYIIAFFSVLDGLADGTIEEAIESGGPVSKGPANKVGGLELLTNLADLKDDPMAMLDYFYDNELDLENLTFGKVAESKMLTTSTVDYEADKNRGEYVEDVDGFDDFYNAANGFESDYESDKKKYYHNTSGYPGPVAESLSLFLEKSKPDFLDLDGDGDKEEPMKKAAKDKKKGKKKNELNHIDEEQHEIDEFSTMAGGAVQGYSLPLGASNKRKSKQKDHHKLFEEQLERILQLQAFHQKTTNKLK